MKICTKCLIPQPLNNFTKQKLGKNGVTAACKSCEKLRKSTVEAIVYTIYSSQKGRIRKYGYSPIEYTKSELQNWLINQPAFKAMYFAWVKSGHKSQLKPSVDRLDDYRTYSLDNIQLLTWSENKLKGHKDRLSGVNTKISTAVDQFTLTGEFVERFVSFQAAARSINKPYTALSNCCAGRVNTAYGHIWKYSSIPNGNALIHCETNHEN